MRLGLACLSGACLATPTRLSLLYQEPREWAAVRVMAPCTSGGLLIQVACACRSPLLPFLGLFRAENAVRGRV